AARGARDERPVHLPDGAAPRRKPAARRRDILPFHTSMARRMVFSRVASGIRSGENLSRAAQTLQRQPLPVCLPAPGPDRLPCLVHRAFAALSDRAARLRAGTAEHAARDARPWSCVLALTIGVW